METSLAGRVRRVRSKFVYIVQATVGAGLAYVVAHSIFGHPQPFFAPMAVIIILGLSGAERLQRAVQLSAGGVLGVLIGTLLVDLLGSGPVHMVIIIGLSLLVATFLTSAQLTINQVAIGSILIATILPPTGTGGMERALDALIGSAIGLATIAVIPSAPVALARREVSKVLIIASSVLADVARGLREGDVDVIIAAREAVRGTQGDIDRMASAAKSGEETVTVSPFLWGSKRMVRTLTRMIMPVDNAIRGTRVLSRRALVLAEDGDRVSEEQIELIEELADCAQHLGEMYAARAKERQLREATVIPEVVRQLKDIGARAGMNVIERDAVLSCYAVLAQTRSLVVDLLMVCGMSRESAVAMLVPTSETPAYPPEVKLD